MGKRKLSSGAAPAPNRSPNDTTPVINAPIYHSRFGPAYDLTFDQRHTKYAPALQQTEPSQIADSRTGFFDLPTEVRDIIYDWVLTAMLDPEEHEGNPKDRPYMFVSDVRRAKLQWESATCGCDLPVLIIRRPHAPYFASVTSDCHLPDLWLYKASLVSKQFSKEFRSHFWQNNIFHLGEADRNCVDQTDIEADFSKVVEGLGPEAKDLRKLALFKGFFTCMQHGQYATRNEDDAIAQLRKVWRFLHPKIQILLAMTDDVFDGESSPMTWEYFFHCAGSKESASGFVVKQINAEVIDPPGNPWEDFMDHIDVSP